MKYRHQGHSQKAQQLKTLITHFTGPPFVRAIGPLKAVAGIQLIIRCPFSGYPIESIRWEKSRQEITPSMFTSNFDNVFLAAIISSLNQILDMKLRLKVMETN